MVFGGGLENISRGLSLAVEILACLMSYVILYACCNNNNNNTMYIVNRNQIIVLWLFTISRTMYLQHNIIMTRTLQKKECNYRGYSYLITSLYYTLYVHTRSYTIIRYYIIIIIPRDCAQTIFGDSISVPQVLFCIFRCFTYARLNETVKYFD